MYTYTCCMQLRHLSVVCVTTGSHVCTIVCTRAMKHTHTTQRSHSFNVSASVVCGRWRRFTCARLSIAETRASTSSVCVYVGCLRRFTLSVDCGVCACECVVAWCVSARQLHTRYTKGQRCYTMLSGSPGHGCRHTTLLWPCPHLPSRRPGPHGPLLT